ncbi:unnamed protein product [Closterium sp. NIES-54]
MRLQLCQRESLTPQQLCEWYASRGGGGGSSGSRNAAVQLRVPSGGLTQLQRRPRETLTPQQLCEWYVQRGASRSSARYPYVIRTEAAALGASESGTLPGTAPAQALHTFTLDLGASRCFFRDSTTLTTLPAPVPVRLADPSQGPVVARSSTVLQCSAVLSGSLSGLHLPSFSTNLVSTDALQDAMVTTTTLGGQRVSICTCARTGRHLAMFTRRPRSSLYTLATEPPQVAAFAQVSMSGQVAASCTCRLLSHQTLLWHHRLGHPSLPRLRDMHSRLLISGLPRSLPPLPPSPAPPCLPCVEGRKRAAHHSSLFPPMTAPLQTLHMDVWDPARIRGQGRERYFVLVVDDNTWYTTVFPLCSKGEVVDVLIPWIRKVRLQLRERFGQDLPVLRLHSDRGDSPQQNGIARTSMIHAAAPIFCGRLRSGTLRISSTSGPVSPCQKPRPHCVGRGRLAMRLRSGSGVLVPLFAIRPQTSSLPVLSPASSLAFSLTRLAGSFTTPPRAVSSLLRTSRLTNPLPPQGPAPSGVSQVDPLPGTAPVKPRGAESGGAGFGGAEPRGAESEGVEPGGAESEGADSGGAASSGGLAGSLPRLSPQQLREWLVRRAHLWTGATADGGAGDAGAGGAGVTTGAGGTGGTAATGPGGAHTGGTRATETGGVGDAGAGDPTEPGAARAGGTGVGGARAGGARPGGTGAGGAGAGGAGGTVRPRAYFVTLLQQVLGVPSSTSLTPPLLCPPPDQSHPPLLTASPLPAPSPYNEQSGGLTVRREPASRPVLPVRTARRVPRSRPLPLPGTHAMALRPSSVPLRVPLPAPLESSLLEVPDPESHRARAPNPTVARFLATAVTDPSFESADASALVAVLLDFAAACRLDYTTALVAESESANPPSVGGECAPGTDVLEDRQEDFEFLAATVPRFASMLLAPEGDPDAPDIPTPRSYAEAITGPYSSQLRAAMDAEMASWKSTCTNVDKVPPPGANIVDGMWIFRVKRPPGSPPTFKARYVAQGFSQRHGVDYFQTFSPTPKMTTLRVLLHIAALRDYKLHSLDFSTAFLQGSLHKESWLCRPPGFTGSFPAGTQWSLRRPVYCLRQVPREWHDTLRTTLAPSTADPSLFLRTDTSLSPFYVLVYVDDLVFSTGDTEALTLVKSELQKRHTCTELHSYLGLQITWDRARRTITLTPSHMVHQVLQRFGFHFSSPHPTPLSTSHSLSAPPSDESLEPTCPYPDLVGCLMYLMTCTRPDLAYPLSLLACYVAPGRHQKVHWDAAKRVLRYLCSTSGMGLVLVGRGPVVLTGHADASWAHNSATQWSASGYTFSLCSGYVSWRSAHSSSVLSSSCEAEIYAGALAAQELRWLTYMQSDLGEQPRSPPVLYVDNKAMVSLCQEQRLKHITKHIALRYFLARELQQRGQLRLAYVATRANTADVFIKALPPDDHQRFSTVLGLVPTFPHLLIA